MAVTVWNQCCIGSGCAGCAIVRLLRAGQTLNLTVYCRRTNNFRVDTSYIGSFAVMNFVETPPSL